MSGPTAPSPARKEWPLWPIALAIAGFIIVYTYVNWQFRKPGTGAEPFADEQRAGQGPAGAAVPWREVALGSAPPGGDGGPIVTLTYLPMAAGIPREFGVVLPQDAAWPLFVPELRAEPQGEGLVVTVRTQWPEDYQPAGHWAAWSRGAAQRDPAKRQPILSNLRIDLEAGIFEEPNILLLPVPRPAPGAPALAAVSRFVLQPADLPADAARLVVPTRRGMAFFTVAQEGGRLVIR